MRRLKLLTLIPLTLLASCNPITSSSATLIEDMLRLEINSTILDVTWEDNEAIRTLKSNLLEGSVEITTSRYGGFEQVGELPYSLPTSNSNISTNPGDIVLYNSNNIVVFFGSNSWSYTPLGHINNMSNEELTTLLDVPSTTLSLYLD